MRPSIAMGRFRGLDLTIVKPLTFMNDSGLAVRKVLAREHAPLNDLLVVADDFALPFGKLRFRENGGAGGHNGLALDHRRARDREVQPTPDRDRSARPRLRGPRPEPVPAGRAAAARRPARRRRRRGRGVGKPRTEQGGEPVQHVRAPAGRRDAPRRARGGRRPTRRHGRSPDAAPAGGRSSGARTRSDGRPDAARQARPGSTARRTSPRARSERAVAAQRRRAPDLSALPPLLAATGSFAALRGRLGSGVETHRARQRLERPPTPPVTSG